MRNLDVTNLRSFVATADLGGVTRAAAHLNLTQSAVSMQLKRLEDVLGVSLFDRSARRIELSLNGEQLLPYAKRMVQLNDEVIMRLTDQTFEGEITLGVPHDIVYPLVPQVLKSFNASYPRVKVTLKSSSTLQLYEALERGEADIILTTEAELRPGGETLTDMPLRWVGAKGGQCWRRRPLPVAFCQLCIFRPIALAALEANGIDWDLTVDSRDDRAIEALISADLSIGAYLADSIPPHLEVIPQSSGLPDLGMQQINIYAAATARSGMVEALYRLLQSSFSDAPQVRLTA